MMPLDYLLYVVGPPILLAGTYAAWLVWRDGHPSKPDRS